MQGRRTLRRTSTQPALLPNSLPLISETHSLVAWRSTGSTLINKAEVQWRWMGGSLMLAGSEGDVYRGACQMVARGCFSVCGSCWGKLCVCTGGFDVSSPPGFWWRSCEVFPHSGEREVLTPTQARVSRSWTHTFAHLLTAPIVFKVWVYTHKYTLLMWSINVLHKGSYRAALKWSNATFNCAQKSYSPQSVLK